MDDLPNEIKQLRLFQKTLERILRIAKDDSFSPERRLEFIVRAVNHVMEMANRLDILPTPNRDKESK